MGADTFIERHGLVKYGQVKRLKLPCPRWCELCRSADHVAYGFDHCHVHGWVRGVLCGPCNALMYGVDAGKAPLVPPYVEHWRRCPDCLKIGVVSPLPPKRPQRRLSVCAGCAGNGVIWLPSVRRMATCPVCCHAVSPTTVGVSATQRDNSSASVSPEIVTERDQNGAPASEGKGAPASSATSSRVPFLVMGQVGRGSHTP